MRCLSLRCVAMCCYAMLCYAMLCYAMLRYAMLCYAMLCCANLGAISGRLEAVLRRSWGLFRIIFELFWAVWRPTESDPKTTVLATSHFFEDVSSEIALFVRTTS